jgi:isoquinoline 1-oxidoreductase subunit beta
MGMKRRGFLFGCAALTAGGVFALSWSNGQNAGKAKSLTASQNEASFKGWLKIADDDTITVYSPHIDFGQGTHTALAQMLADELDADWKHVRVEQAPAEQPFANAALVRASLQEITTVPNMLLGATDSLGALVSRVMNLQLTGGSTGIRMTGQYGMRVLGAAARLALLETASEQLGLPISDLKTENSKVLHTPSQRSFRYGELAAKAAERELTSTPTLKRPGDFKIIGTSVQRFDIPDKLTGKAIYGIDLDLPDMRIATVIAAPVRGGKLTLVDEAPALAVKGVESVIKLDEAVVVVANGYWPAIQGLRALSPKFSDGGFGSVSSASIFEAQNKLISSGDTKRNETTSFLEATYKVPFLHHATMEPLAISAHFKDGRLQVWGGLQDPLATVAIITSVSGLDAENVKFYPMIMGGGFGRRFPESSQCIAQIVKIAMQLPYPVKLIWSREEDVAQGAYRPQMSARLSATLDAAGRISTWSSHYAQNAEPFEAANVPYSIPEVALKHHAYISNQPDSFWRSVDHSQHGFFTECFVDELAHLAGQDPYAFRRVHLEEGSRHQVVLDEVAKRAGWKSALAPKHGRGIAIVQAMGSIAAHVVEVSVDESGTPKVQKVTAVIDCGLVINPLNAIAQIEGSIIMGLSAALREQITLEKGAVVQTNFSDYPIIQMEDIPEIDIYFVPSDAPPGGVGEPGLPPVAPALANAIFAASGKRIRQLPIL